MNFSTLVSTVRQNVFPEGTPEELDDRHKNVIKDALIDLQKRVKCFQLNNRSVWDQDDTFFSCGATVVDAPRGHMKQLFTAGSSDFCDKVIYQPVSKAYMDQLLIDHEVCGKSYSPYEYYDDQAYYFEYANSTVDKSCRALEGFWSMFDNEIWVYPHIQSTEQLVLDWYGIKRDWADADVVTFHDREVEQAVEYYLEMDAYRHDDCNTDKYLTARNEYNNKRADLISECRKEGFHPPAHSAFSNCSLPA